MNDQQQIRADALTDEQIRKIAEKHFWGGRLTTVDDLEKAIRAALRAASPVEQPAAAPIEEMIRFCPECGRLGDIPAGYEACCPDWSQARIVPKRFAELCAETFRLCVSQPFPKSSAAPADERDKR
ncbi:hypothetical protein [Burkholderia multivorans]|uniref:hypothetical protein n=1 Tax=Burkholderia multivorans TaxID=87883 RepID=UPI0020B29876|nr:hypothetical protein [Burkholderia multivorans]